MRKEAKTLKIDRQIGILSILLQQEKVTAPYLAEKFQVSRRTINRDIEDLCMAGIPLVTTQGANGGIAIMEGYKIDRALLTSADMQAILAGLRSLDSVSKTNRYAVLMEKLSAGASNMVSGDQHILIDLSSWYRSTLSEKIERIHMAIEQYVKITFLYSSPKEESWRTVEPYYLIFQWAAWYVWGWCEKRQDFRLFKLNRMTELSKEGNHFQQREVPYPVLSSKEIFPPNFPIKAVVAQTFKWRLIEEFGKESFEELEDGNLLFSYDFIDETSAFNWILSFGEAVELLEPVCLKQKLAVFGKSLMIKYTK